MADERALRWPELIPAALADVPLQPERIDHDADVLTQASPWGELPMTELLVPELDAQDVRIDGFIVPLDLTGERVREFLLVPYFGACVHVPPPPPNQVIHVTSEDGLPLDRIYEAWTVTGRLSVGPRSSAMADAGYAIAATSLRLYGS